MKEKIVFYCDDDLIMRLGFQRLISSLEINIKLILFENAESLLDKLKNTENPFAVFSDQDMGNGMTGLELIDEINSLKINIIKVIVTNTPLSIFEDNAISAGADYCIQSPISRSELERILSL